MDLTLDHDVDDRGLQQLLEPRDDFLVCERRVDGTHGDDDRGARSLVQTPARCGRIRLTTQRRRLVLEAYLELLVEPGFDDTDLEAGFQAA